MVVGEGSMVAGEETGMGSSRCTGSMSLHRVSGRSGVGLGCWMA